MTRIDGRAHSSTALRSERPGIIRAITHVTPLTTASNKDVLSKYCKYVHPPNSIIKVHINPHITESGIITSGRKVCDFFQFSVLDWLFFLYIHT